MIVERLTFQAKYGKGDELVELFREYARDLAGRMPGKVARGYTDSTGRMFTVIVDTEYADYAEVAKASAAEQEAYGSPEFQAWFAKMVPLVEHGERQLLNVIEM